MALSATVYHLQIDLSDVDRDIYQKLDLRVARHPSETMRYLLTRVLAYALNFEEGIALSKGGLSDPDEPAASVRDLQGNLRVWIEVGSPSAERLHKASKACPRVVVFTHANLELMKKAARAKAIHRADEIEVYAVDPAFLDALDAVTSRNSAWTLVRTEATLYLTSANTDLTMPLPRQSLSP
jgi:uncharacterized protein YaeQ